MNIQDRKKTLTVEELRRRYNLDALDKDRKAIKLQKDQLTKVDAELNDFVEITTKNIKELQDQVDGNITTWFFNGVPTMETEPAINWTTDTDKNNHLGDLYYDQDTGYAYRFYLDGTTNEYGWMQVIDSDVAEALAIANSAKDTADSKRRVFVVEPIPPYDIGDIWIKEDTDLYRCRASRNDGNFNTADWIRATNYTDDTVALGTKAELDQFKTQVTENYVSNAMLETTVNSITGRVEETYTYITTVENQVVDITQTTNTVEDSNELYITDSLESNVLEYHIEGKSEQDGTPTPEAPVEIKTIGNGSEVKVKVTGKNILIPDFEAGDMNLETGLNEVNNGRIRTKGYVKVKPSKSYIFNQTANRLIQYDKNYNFISVIYGAIQFNTTANTKYIRVSFPNTSTDIQLEEGSTVTEYEAYKEKEVLIDLSKPNLYDGVSESGNISTSDGSNTTADNAWRSTNYLPIDNLTNTLEINDINYTGTVGRMYFYDESKTYISNVLIDKLPYVFTAPTDTKYIRFFVLNSVATLDTNVKIYEGYTDYYELSSIGDTKDKLSIIDGQVVINKKIDKVVLDGSTEIIIYSTASSGNGFYVKVNGIFYGGSSSAKRGTLLSNMFLEKTRNEIYLGNEGIAYNYDSSYLIIYNSETSNMTTADFKTWLSENPVTVYYELKESQQIILPNTNISLFEGVNRITLVDDIETKTSIKYLRNTPISSEYATNQQLGETNSNLANTTDKTNQNASDISATNTNLNNNYYNKEQIDAVQTTTEQVITEIRNTVETSVTATQANIDVINQTLQNGVEKVSTSTGYTFDSEGLHIKKSDEDLESLVDNTGIYVNNNDENMLTANSDGVKATNLEAKNFFILHPFRLEETVAMTDNSVKGIGFFYIGDE